VDPLRPWLSWTLIAASVAALALSHVGRVRAGAAVLGAALGAVAALGLAFLMKDRDGVFLAAFAGAPLGVAAAQWVVTHFGLAPGPAATRPVAWLAAGAAPLLALFCGAVDQFLNVSFGTTSWPPALLAWTFIAACFASAAGWAALR
jgi:hypothetical protein